MTDEIDANFPLEDTRLNSRRIRAAVLERQVVLRRRRWRIVFGIALLVVGGQLAIDAINAARGRRPFWAAGFALASTGCLTGFALLLRRMSTVPEPPEPELPSPDFSTLGNGPDLAQRLEQMVGDDDV